MLQNVLASAQNRVAVSKEMSAPGDSASECTENMVALVRSSGMVRSNPLLWPKLPQIWGYGIAVLAVATAVILTQWPALHLEEAPLSLCVFAVMLTAWVGGVGPGLLATSLSILAFYYHHSLSPIHSFGVNSGLPRFIAFSLSLLIVGLLTAAQRSATESLRRAHDHLKGVVKELRRTNEALQAESSERKHAEEKLQQSQADLARVSRVTTMGELTASLAHEVNQPIAAAVTNANTCLRWLTRDSPDLEEARAAAMRIVKDGTRAAEIITRVRLLFQKGAPQRELVDLNEVIREMILLLRSETVRYNISVGADLAVDLPQVLADRVQLQQVMMNLMLNSVDAIKNVDGARELIIRSRRSDNGQIVVSVSDTGVGLPHNQTNQIFNAFFTTKSHGTGMGLSISRSIVESHGGRLWFADNPPRGAIFFLALPIKVEAHE
ncbi:MAG: multi-sensor signal transduction histidine kinase [Candidatus Acidoferrum typicum]|nr:multi-sensor signal transduction histidine kinase [Candidatus Acidoferrum typicum]